LAKDQVYAAPAKTNGKSQVYLGTNEADAVKTMEDRVLNAAKYMESAELTGILMD